MYETPEDLQRLQALLDDSYARAGDHLRTIHTDEARSSADDVVARLDGMRVFVVAPSWAIDPDRMFAADVTVHQQAGNA